MPREVTMTAERGPCMERRSREVSDRMPPSPSLSARMTMTTYLNDTVIARAQNTREITPYTSSGVGATAL